ncbi:hypothetical protein QH494_11300 [Sphingomonas sp. AR_OL41]|uniref:hypothetical protein n=1 Tax=Sphingomonas sp. AR_OL41 TaxID=3042729 RepID=UPI0024802A81|nr:hypothetical protein [Sphingomonas sp. AR_OL41]MDH7972766.1 hypothetical protein [Sphingomonas sp. AR_OL41]MDH7972772.1 hypothetical protein [Sphingomonas sp. AR_OL41]
MVFAAIVTRIMRLKPKLRYSIHHSANILVDQPLMDGDGKQIQTRQLIRTASIVVGNEGLQAAKGVEIAFNWKPTIMNITPARAFTDVSSSFDRYSLKFDSFAPGEQSTIEIMSFNAELPVMTAVRSDDSVGKLINMSPQRVWPAWFINSLVALLLLGGATLIYLIITVARMAIG